MTAVELVWTTVIVGILVMLLVPALSRVPPGRKRVDCVSNLKQVGIGFRVWAGDNGDKYPMEISTNLGGTKEYDFTPDVFRVFQTMQNELGQSPSIVICPMDHSRIPATNFMSFGNSNLSYFVGMNASLDSVDLGLLGGDRSLNSPRGPLRGVTVLTTNTGATWRTDLHKDANGGGAGNIMFSDGSAVQLSTVQLQNLLTNRGVTPATLVIP